MDKVSEALIWRYSLLKGCLQWARIYQEVYDFNWPLRITWELSWAWQAAVSYFFVQNTWTLRPVSLLTEYPGAHTDLDLLCMSK